MCISEESKFVCIVSVGAQDMCKRYWPPVKQEEMYGKVQVKNLKETFNPHYILREFLVHHEEVRWCGRELRGVEKASYTQIEKVDFYKGLLCLFQSVSTANMHMLYKGLQLCSQARMQREAEILLLASRFECASCI